MVKGLAEVHARLAAVPAAIIEEVEKELEALAAQLLSEMRSIIPRDEGDLKDSLGWERVRKRGSVEVRFTKAGKAYGYLGVRLHVGRGLRRGNDKESYAIYQEFGTQDMPANPYFFPVWRANKRRVKTRISRAITRALKRI